MPNISLDSILYWYTEYNKQYLYCNKIGKTDLAQTNKEVRDVLYQILSGNGFMFNVHYKRELVEDKELDLKYFKYMPM